MGSMLILDRFPAFGRSRSRWGSLVEHCSVVCVRHRVSIALLDLQHTFRFFRKKKHFKVKENLWTVNRKTEFPDFWQYQRFSLTLKNFQFSLTFPWPWQPCSCFCSPLQFVPDFPTKPSNKLVLNLDFISLSFASYYTLWLSCWWILIDLALYSYLALHIFSLSLTVDQDRPGIIHGLEFLFFLPRTFSAVLLNA